MKTIGNHIVSDFLVLLGAFSTVACAILLRLAIWDPEICQRLLSAFFG